nr:universal stress protein [Microbacterium sp. Se63.02b]
MTDSTSTPSDEAAQNAALQKAVIVGMQLDQDPHVLAEAVRYARLLGAPLVVAHVDVTRFVTYEDPDGYVHSAPIDINFDAGAAEFEAVEAAAAKQLQGTDVTWTARQLVGDPALAIKQLAHRLDAQLIVVGTRKRGIGESIRSSSRALSRRGSRIGSIVRSSWCRSASRCRTSRRRSGRTKGGAPYRREAPPTNRRRGLVCAVTPIG